jgi:hypothetical protein
MMFDIMARNGAMGRAVENNPMHPIPATTVVSIHVDACNRELWPDVWELVLLTK